MRSPSVFLLFLLAWPGIQVCGTQPDLPLASTDSDNRVHQRAPVTVEQAWTQRLNLQSEPVRRETLTDEIRTAATVVPAEQHISHVHTRVAGWIMDLHVRTTGESVQAGQPVAAIFSQDLYASQLEYLAARARTGGARSDEVTGSARRRLLVMGISEAELQDIERQGKARHLVTLTAPRSGFVLRRSVTAGTAVDPSTELLTLADLSVVWIMAEVSERDTPRITRGMPAVIDIPASGQAPLQAQVDFIYPTLSERTRSLRLRLEVHNKDLRLLPGMTGTVRLLSSTAETLTVPRDAVVDTGEEQHVFVISAPSIYEPRVVRTGIRTRDRIEILAGVRQHERVLSSGVFLIDSESRLRGSGSGTGHGGHGTGAPAQPAENPHQGH